MYCHILFNVYWWCNLKQQSALKISVYIKGNIVFSLDLLLSGSNVNFATILLLKTYSSLCMLEVEKVMFNVKPFLLALKLVKQILSQVVYLRIFNVAHK